MGKVLVGVAGWEYPDWNGTVYPAGSGRAIDRLVYISRFVDVVEINSTFYHPARPQVAESWARRAGRNAEFRFTAKSHRSWTHDRDPDLTTAVPSTLEGLMPLRDSGILSAVLVQFPQSFRPVQNSLDRLSRISELAAGWPLVVEVRHKDWDYEGVSDWFEQRGLGWCVVDQPSVGGVTIGAAVKVTSGIGYIRLHGRNRANWFRKDAGRDARYDYLYSMEEITPLAEMASRMAEIAEEVIVIQNNHRKGQALANSIQITSVLGRGDLEAPEALLDTYPELGEICGSRRERLF